MDEATQIAHLKRRLATSERLIRWLVIEFLKMECRAESAELVAAQQEHESTVLFRSLMTILARIDARIMSSTRGKRSVAGLSKSLES